MGGWPLGERAWPWSAQVLYGAVPAAYTREPWECVNYAACHDNETLYDQVRGAACN